MGLLPKSGEAAAPIGTFYVLGLFVITALCVVMLWAGCYAAVKLSNPVERGLE